MPFAETPLRDEYAAAVEQLARRTLDALRDGAPVAALPEPPGPEETGSEETASRPLLAAVRVLGADLFAPRLLAGAEPDGPTAALLARALRTFPAPAAPSPEAARVVEWQDWAVGRFLARTPYGEAAPVPPVLPGPEEAGWQAWSVRMSQLSGLALPGLDGPVHAQARAHSLDLARGTVRSLLRHDLTTAARLVRWLSWTGAEGLPPRLEVEPVLDRIRLAGDGSARTGLGLAVARRLLDGPADGRRAA
ncbi:hypothetical protein K353_03491 [Kitasatospora sp. SolWspMP-SS2h]|uniref:hypothetical protein n=1 Tax=Kitasatospora sp. SolWspMP-SS2h TaxID=1305729 RepID=UPI000DB96ACA|nr:hypothetical protein [Kitasatospora sp. SolWspMP-SS2h]RAJ40003.1 hypothetical protein K353_03491 [Kitasatospora sp. SolWspMP-SS2h]